MRGVHGCMVFETLLADNFQEFLEARHLDNGAAAKGIQRVVNKLAVPCVGTDHAIAIIRRDPRIAEGTRRGTTRNGSISIFRAERRCEYFRIGHLDVSKKALGPVAAVKEDALVRVVSVIVIPIHKSTGSAR